MLTRRFRLLGVIAFLTLTLFYFAHKSEYDYTDIQLPSVKIPKGWMRKDENGSWGLDRGHSSKKGKGADPARKYRWGVSSADVPAIEEAERLAEAAAQAAAEKEIEDKAKEFVPPSKLEEESYEPGGKSGKDDEDDIDWTKYAYAQYATDSEYLCSAVMVFEALHRLGALAERVLMYPADMLEDVKSKKSKSEDGQLIIKARDEYQVKLAPIEVQHIEMEDTTWGESYTKLLAFNQTQYERVLHLDADGWVLAPMDELFLLPEAPVAMPRAYWLLHDDPPKRVLSSQIILLQPSKNEFARLQGKIMEAREGQYDMEIVNDLYFDSAMVLPHRKYDLLTAEFRSNKHSAYLGSDKEEWDPLLVYNEAKYMHFSDWPVPKPWIPMLEEDRESMQPDCKKLKKGEDDDCTERVMWNSFYDDYLKSRNAICYNTPSKKARR